MQQGFGRSRKVAALFEVIGVLVLGHLLAGWVAPWLGVPALGSLFQSAIKSQEPDFLRLSGALFHVLVVQYACVLTLAFAIGWWQRRRSFRQYGLTLAGQPWLGHVGLGVLGFLIFALPVQLLWLANAFFPLGPGPEFWALLDKRWTLSFWLFMAVSSFVFVPLVEELFYRGYCQTRLQEDSEGMSGAIIVGLTFAFMHAQYHRLSVMSIGMMVAMVPIGLGAGYLYWRTRSLVAPVVFHAALNLAALNVAVRGFRHVLLPVVMVGLLLLFRRRVRDMVRDFWGQIAAMGSKAAVLCASLAVVAVGIGFQRWPKVLLPVAVLALAVALSIEFRERRRARRNGLRVVQT